MPTQITVLERQMAAGFWAHPDAEVVRSLPGPGTIVGAWVLGEFGDAPGRLRRPQVAQELRWNVTDHQGLRHQDSRAGPPTSAASASPTRSTRGPSLRSPPAWEPAPATTPSVPRATSTTGPLRALGNRLVGIFHGCLAEPHHLQRNDRLGPPSQHPAHPRRLTSCGRGMSRCGFTRTSSSACKRSRRCSPSPQHAMPGHLRSSARLAVYVHNVFWPFTYHLPGCVNDGTVTKRISYMRFIGKFALEICCFHPGYGISTRGKRLQLFTAKNLDQYDSATCNDHVAQFRALRKRIG
jgi:hypothetical protein